MLESQTSGFKTPQNLISPLPSPAPQTISVEINTATRSVHSRLNKLIVARLPFALPPHSDDPELFAIGVDRFAQIYLTFEAAWHEYIKQERPGLSAHDEKFHGWLADLVPSGLWRTKSIREDLGYLNAAFGLKLNSADAVSPRDQALVDHIRKATAEKPHKLIAYAWIMYMAIFSGGRWIRQQLLDAGPAFWRADEDDRAEESTFRSSRCPVPGFSLFYFEGERDGEDIKTDFKARLELAEALLTAEQRREVCAEAQFIFDACIGLVDKLDEELATSSKPSTFDQDAYLEKAQASHSTSKMEPDVRSESSGSSRALSAVFLGLVFWYIWLWVKT